MTRNTAPTKTTVALVLTRDADSCSRCGKPNYGARGWDWSIHHRCPRGIGGSKSVAWINRAANLVTLCGSGTTGCHGWIENHRALAYEQGWLVSRLRLPIPSEVPLPHIIYGRVYLDDFGGYTEGTK